jgi:hypothetical protein
MSTPSWPPLPLRPLLVWTQGPAGAAACRALTTRTPAATGRSLCLRPSVTPPPYHQAVSSPALQLQSVLVCSLHFSRSALPPISQLEV